MLVPAVRNLRDSTSDYVTRALAEKEGHRVLFQPPHHPDFQATGIRPFLRPRALHNFTEYCWAHVKTWVRLNKTESKLAHVKALIEEKMDSLTASDWNGSCRRVDSYRDEMWNYTGLGE